MSRSSRRRSRGFDSGAADEGIRFSRDSRIARDRRARRIWLEDRPERLAIVARARVQFARPARRAVRARRRRANSSKCLSRGQRQGRGTALRGHRHVEPAAQPEARPASRRAAARSRRSSASTATCRRANSSAPRAASRSAGARPRAGTRASSCAAASARSASTTSSPSPTCSQDRENSRQPRPRPAAELGNRDRGRARARRVGQDAAQALRPPHRRHHRHHPDRRGRRRRSAICRARPASARRSRTRSLFDPIGWKGAKLDADVRASSRPACAIR